MTETEKDELKNKHSELYAIIQIALDEKLGDICADLQKVKFEVENIQQDVQSLTDTTARNTGDMQKVGSRVDELEVRLNKVTEVAILKPLELELHERKWNIIISGVQGAANESSLTTRQSVYKLGDAVFGGDYYPQFVACHRLDKEANAKIIVDFMDLEDRNYWLDNARLLKGYNVANNTKISFSPDLPPPLRPIQNDLLTARRNMSPELKKVHHLKYTNKWPYVVMQKKGQKEPIKSKITKTEIIDAVFNYYK